MGKKRTKLLACSQEVFTIAHDQFMLDQEKYKVSTDKNLLKQKFTELDAMFLEADHYREMYHFRALEEKMMQIGILALGIAMAVAKRNELAA